MHRAARPPGADAGTPGGDLVAVDDAMSVHPTQATFTSGLDLATLTAGRVVEARVVSLAQTEEIGRAHV